MHLTGSRLRSSVEDVCPCETRLTVMPLLCFPICSVLSAGPSSVDCWLAVTAAGTYPPRNTPVKMTSPGRRSKARTGLGTGDASRMNVSYHSQTVLVRVLPPKDKDTRRASTTFHNKPRKCGGNLQGIVLHLLSCDGERRK